MEAVKLDTNIFVIKDFLTKEECEKWIAFSEAEGYELAKINMGFRQQVVNRSVRNNERVIYDNHELAAELWQRIKPFVIPETKHGLACGLNECFRFYRYESGQQFRPHCDGSYIRNYKEWSSYTLLIYLNEEMEGGETTFPKVSVVPTTGLAVIFQHEIVHAGTVLKKGVKYVLRTDIMYRRKD